MPEPRKESPIEATFRRLRTENRRAFIPYITAGYPDPDRTLDVLRMLADAGADLIELGIPFSDPLADGPIIQRAAWQALRSGVDVEAVLDWTAAFAADHDVPIVLFTYLNPVLRFGPERFVARARGTGAAGLLITDLPAGEDERLETVLGGGGPDLVRLLAPTTAPARVQRIARSARGFIYYISRTGVTGEREDVRGALSGEIRRIRGATPLPVAVGFGISTGEQATRVAEVADGVVVGSALVRALSDDGIEGARRLAAELRAGVDAASG